MIQTRREEDIAMGFWDSSPFGNDDAADFAYALDLATPEQRIDLVGAVLERIATASLSEDLDIFDAPRAVAAAALVAAQCPGGKPLDGVYGPSDAMPQFPSYLRRLAVDALDRLLTPPSWLAEDWDDGREWHRSIAGLRNVLEPPQLETLFEV